jgi:hypothetical protein
MGTEREQSHSDGVMAAGKRCPVRDGRATVNEKARAFDI